MRIRVMRINVGPFQTATVGSLIHITFILSVRLAWLWLGMRYGRNVSMRFGFCIMWTDTTRIIMRFIRSRIDML